MHYKDGTQASAGDLVIRTEMSGTRSISGNQTVGILSGAFSHSTACNGNIIPVAHRQLSDLGWGPWLPVGASSPWSVTLSQCERIDKMPSDQPVPPVTDAEPSKQAAPAN